MWSQVIKYFLSFEILAHSTFHVLYSHFVVVSLLGEEIVNAAEREVLEETSVRAKFKEMICFRHVHNFTFGCSDMYFIVALVPEPGQDVLKKCDREIAAVEWMNVSNLFSMGHYTSSVTK